MGTSIRLGLAQLVLVGLVLIGCAPALPATTPHPAGTSAGGGARVGEVVTGIASYYADRFHLRRTASGVPYDKDQLVAAHRSYPFGTVLRVTNLANGRSVTVRVIDRGPFVEGRILDLSRRAAEELGFIEAGLTEVRIEVIE